MATLKGKVLVVGATGALGRPAVRLLLERGVAVRAVCRHPQQAADLAELGAEVVAGDLTDSASLAHATTGVQRVLAAAHGMLGRGRWCSEAVDDAGHRRLFAAARHAGVDRLVYTSAYGAGPGHPIDFFRTKHTMEQVLAASGLTHVVLRPTAFMEHHVHHFNGAGLLAKGKAQLIGPGTKVRNFVAASDVARFAVRALVEDPLPFRRLDIGSPGHYSNNEVAALYARCAGVPLRIGHLPAGLAGWIAKLAKPVHPGVARILELSSLPDEAYSERFEGAQALAQEYGVTLTTLPQFVEDRVAQWRRAGRT